jgi:hypothetical protein
MAFKDYPSGLEGSELWKPYQAAKNIVERYSKEPQEPGCDLSLLRYDSDAGILEIHLRGLKLPSACPRFASRACPRMVPMGHEASHETCNYWDYPKMHDFAPKLELYPEWQRFDCHKFYPLFQVHLVGSELARSLNSRALFFVEGVDPKLLSVYASLSSDPSAFSGIS